MATLALNKQARHNYHILETYEAGLILKGYEVKAIKGNQANLKGSYISFKKQNGNLVPFLLQAHIPLYRPAGIVENYEAQAPRQLLLHRSEINRLLGKAKEAGLTLIPLRIYTKHSFLKLEIAVAKGKKQVDKREDIKKRDLDRRLRSLTKRKV